MPPPQGGLVGMPPGAAPHAFIGKMPVPQEGLQHAVGLEQGKSDERNLTILDGIDAD